MLRFYSKKHQNLNSPSFFIATYTASVKTLLWHSGKPNYAYNTLNFPSFNLRPLSSRLIHSLWRQIARSDFGLSIIIYMGDNKNFAWNFALKGAFLPKISWKFDVFWIKTSKSPFERGLLPIGHKISKKPF